MNSFQPIKDWYISTCTNQHFSCSESHTKHIMCVNNMYLLFGYVKPFSAHVSKGFSQDATSITLYWQRGQFWRDDRLVLTKVGSKLPGEAELMTSILTSVWKF